MQIAASKKNTAVNVVVGISRVFAEQEQGQTVSCGAPVLLRTFLGTRQSQRHKPLGLSRGVYVHEPKSFRIHAHPCLMWARTSVSSVFVIHIVIKVDLLVHTDQSGCFPLCWDLPQTQTQVENVHNNSTELTRAHDT